MSVPQCTNKPLVASVAEAVERVNGKAPCAQAASLPGMPEWLRAVTTALAETPNMKSAPQHLRGWVEGAYQQAVLVGFVVGIEYRNLQLVAEQRNDRRAQAAAK